ncbi:glutamic acid-rich protein-like [Pistacia vera]|uniref:glutamic acid-rich protein-like n=1 Tax=Pistacia vera TaxID=55513 RepID=UPI001263C23E|nr:glutamic acid-rich protein-like [Pistacia vera]
MSRCFPYPPPGYVKNGIRDEALIESIKGTMEEELKKSCDLKLQREGEKAKKKRKERKKEKKLEKKEKEKVQGSEAVESKKHRHKKRHKDDRNQEDQKEGGLQKKTENELEKSILTEEHGHPHQKTLSSPLDGENNSGECLCVFAFRWGGCLLIGFVFFTWALMFFLQIVIINTKEAASESGCLSKGKMIQKFTQQGIALLCLWGD